MKPNNQIIRARSSLTARCLTLVFAFAALLLASVFTIDALADRQLSIAFPSLDTVLEHEEALTSDRFDLLSTDDLSACHIAIFNENGTMLYSSSTQMAESARYETMLAMNEYDLYDKSSFAGMPSCTVQKYSYFTSTGEARTMMLALPVISEATFTRIVQESGRLWLLLIPLVIAFAAATAMILARLICKAISPIDNAIKAYRNQGKIPSKNTTVATELQGALDGFSDLARQLEGVRLEKQRLIADASHDLKTPLTVIKGYAQALDDNRVPPEKHDAYVKAIIARSTTAAELIDALFSYTKMEHPNFIAQRSIEDLGEIVQAVASECRLDVEQAGCILTCHIDPGPLTAYVDRSLISRMLANLIDNARKHNLPATVIHLECQRRGSKIELCVADEGQGIPEKLRTSAFDPFVTNDEARTAGTGTGLGLSIARRCAELNGGSIRFSNHPKPPRKTEILITLDKASGLSSLGKAPS